MYFVSKNQYPVHGQNVKSAGQRLLKTRATLDAVTATILGFPNRALTLAIIRRNRIVLDIETRELKGTLFLHSSGFPNRSTGNRRIAPTQKLLDRRTISIMALQCLEQESRSESLFRIFEERIHRKRDQQSQLPF